MNSENQESPGSGKNVLNFQNILNNKFDYFNNKPSKYYEIAFYYYPDSPTAKKPAENQEPKTFETG
jgi:hypothetical protein